MISLSTSWLARVAAVASVLVAGLTGCGERDCEGSYTVQNSMEVDEIKGCTSITGDLVVNSGVEELILPRLQEVGGGFLIETGKSSLVEVPLLGSVGGGLGINASAAEKVSLPSIVTVGGNLDLRGGEASTSIEIPSLKNVDGDLALYGGDVPVSFDLSSLETVGGSARLVDTAGVKDMGTSRLATIAGDLTISGNTRANIEIPALELIGNNLIVEKNWGIERLSLPKLRCVYGILGLSFTSLRYLVVPDLQWVGKKLHLRYTDIEVLHAPVIDRVGELFIRENDELARIEMPSLLVADYLHVRMNNKLCNEYELKRRNLSVKDSKLLGYNGYGCDRDAVVSDGYDREAASEYHPAAELPHSGLVSRVMSILEGFGAGDSSVEFEGDPTVGDVQRTPTPEGPLDSGKYSFVLAKKVEGIEYRMLFSATVNGDQVEGIAGECNTGHGTRFRGSVVEGGVRIEEKECPECSVMRNGRLIPVAEDVPEFVRMSKLYVDYYDERFPPGTCD